MSIYLLTYFLLIIFLVIGIGAFINYEITWWRYERMIRACNEKLRREERV